MQLPGESPKQFLRTFTESEHQSGQSYWSKTEGIEGKESNLKWVNYYFLVSMASFGDSNCFPIIISLKNT